MHYSFNYFYKVATLFIEKSGNLTTIDTLIHAYIKPEFH